MFGESENERCLKNTFFIERIISVKASHYHARQGQTDSTPLLTASMRIIDTVKLKNGKLKWLAMSRDFLKTFNKKALFKYGDSVEVLDIGKLSGKYMIADCMDSIYRQKIDILVHHKRKFKHFEKAKIRFKTKKRYNG